MDLVCVITGGASGIGLECGIQFLEQNKNNKLSIIDLKIPSEVKQQLTQKFGSNRILFFEADVTNEKLIEECFKKTIQQFQSFDILLNNAGIGIHENLILDNLENFAKNYRNIDLTLQINLISVIKLTILAIHFMKKQNKPGHIINVASQGGLYPQGDAPIYCATKHGVVGFTKSIKFLHKEFNIRTNVICPSFIDTPLVRTAIEQRTGGKVQPGQLIDLGVAVSTKSVGEAFLQIVNDPSANGEIVHIQTAIFREKFKPYIKIPGESERGGALIKLPTKEQVTEFKRLKMEERQKILQQSKNNQQSKL